MYWIGPLLGGALARLMYRYVFASDAEREPTVIPTTTSPVPPASPPPPSRERTERL